MNRSPGSDIRFSPISCMCVKNATHRCFVSATKPPNYTITIEQVKHTRYTRVYGDTEEHWCLIAHTAKQGHKSLVVERQSFLLFIVGQRSWIQKASRASLVSTPFACSSLMHLMLKSCTPRGVYPMGLTSFRLRLPAGCSLMHLVLYLFPQYNVSPLQVRRHIWFTTHFERSYSLC